ncbi:MAG: hypothetical protein A3I26_03220 [Candidatus Yanofskybacteria bacterium RIFCSPLOWO2_02_FULL_43_10]|uniref:Uncharacterized protein n=1 Tax=Candidatus Yanofskybacteria bacterium RIFCSPLOWO2_12_FULL_43_11b TaxID=1802710 RepID=A0A1F8H6H4_9BACT|nr:MAG: hypothetical protein A2742_01450 [Candidatus Yanofskybacteria bacterium RIFCSPHIGHO2_01_FULL_43_32]OGN12001.1 MAG: hypothetical protein A3C69_02985 [Candidatus Yanofskybacteria bacterium RIFCSPHIGHO2_02_FULL_43_12]OGN17829.1 MAG: hypothetical protein A3E34_01185 [Candidatus Yanofskybacteria bacterium RIFCSPHIGHO2_12_FULL_43_11]OGN24787.1 MAG: hypothetical protein A2923_03140 [Candidatus Yanofskybacteria bacterium RIFCSPLOWO2_01_FULL_43_46]OGN28962.1 MAG: hypothetical protein A3I26_03220
MWSLYLKYNPIIVFVLRPILRLVDAHNHPLLGGVATAIASGLVHYGIILPFCWQEAGLIASLAVIPIAIHALFCINILSNLLLGVSRYTSGKYGNRPINDTRGA